MKKYVEDNLTKRFIKASKVPFTLPMLFICKLRGRLQFYIDYYKLNVIIRKDLYLLPLINETLA
jgi:hypothetical protein